MSTAPLLMGQSVLPAAPNNSAGVTSVNDNSNNLPVNDGNQGSDLSFPGLMKRISLNGKVKKADGQIPMIAVSALQVPTVPASAIQAPVIQASIIQTSAIQAPAIQASAANQAPIIQASAKPTGDVLPPSGVVLPPVLSQDAPPDGTPPENAANGSFPPVPTGPKVEIPLAARGEGAAQAGDKLPLTAQDSPALVGVDKTTNSAGKADMPPRDSLIFGLNAASLGAHEMQHAVQAAASDLGNMSAAQHTEGAGISHPAVDIANMGIGGNSQSATTDKMAPAAAAPPIAVPLQHAEWGDELSNRVTWMIRQDVQSASIKLNPPHLGPLEVKISVMNDQVNVSFSSHHAPVREALDASMPRLKEMLGDNGLQLGDANVTHRSFSEHNHANNQSSSQQYQENISGNDPVADGGGELKSETHYIPGGAAIDLYA